MSRPDYPAAPRLDLVEELPEGAPTHSVADPYRWLEDPADPAVEAWSGAQDTLVRQHLDSLPGRSRVAERLRALGANVENGVPMLSHVRVDRGLITGQNPKSSRKAAERLVEALAAPRAH